MKTNDLELFWTIVADCLDVERTQLTDEARFKDDLGADSLDLAELALAIEDGFAVTVKEEELIQLETVGEAILHLTLLLEGQQ